LLFLVHKTERLCVSGNSTLQSKAFADSQSIDDVTQNWPSDDDIPNIEEMTQDQDLKFHDPLLKSKFKIYIIPY
jgi:hypothetical protein